MKKAVLVVGMLLICAMGGQSQAKVSKSKTIEIGEPAGWLDGFKVGSSELQNQHLEKLQRVAVYLKQNPDKDFVVRGSVSIEGFPGGDCFVSYDLRDFNVSKPANNVKHIIGEKECQNYLGLSRVENVISYLRMLGINDRRMHSSNRVDIGSRPGDNSKNRAVSYWYVKMPKNCQVQRIREDMDGTFLDLKCGRKAGWLKAWWDDLKSKFPKPKSRIKEKQEQKEKEK